VSAVREESLTPRRKLRIAFARFFGRRRFFWRFGY